MPAVFIPTDDGRWVSAEFERLARNIQNYDPELELRWIPPDRRTREDKSPYTVWDKRPSENAPFGRAILYASELDTPADILTRLYLADSKTGNVLDKIEAHNLAIRNLQLQEWLDEREEMKEQARFLLFTPLHYVRFGGKKLNEHRKPVE